MLHDESRFDNDANDEWVDKTEANVIGVIVSKHICMTRDIASNGNLFGGIMLSWLDEAGAIAAMEYACTHRMVTLKMGEVIFKKPVKVHDIVCIYAIIGKVGNTSVTIKLQARTNELEIGKEELVAETEMVFVKVDENGNPEKLF